MQKPARPLSAIEEIIEDARNGRMVVLVDDEDRENEGDLVIPAQMATPEAINFMASYGRGLICLSMRRQQIERLQIPMMPQSNQSRFKTAFTVSIEAREGVSTGISAPDRARTIAVAIDGNSSAADIATPGHVFPLMAREGGVLERAGHTEAAVDIARLAGLNPSGVICEIMSQNGEMARLPELLEFSAKHGLKIGSIADLIAYRRRHHNMVRLLRETKIQSRHGGTFHVKIFANQLNNTAHLALVKGDISLDKPVLVRMHALSLWDDVLGNVADGKSEILAKSMTAIAKEGRGVLVLLRDTNPRLVPEALDDNAPSSTLKNPPETYAAQKAASQVMPLRDYGVGAQILVALGVREMVLLSNTDKHIIGLEGYDLKVVRRQAVI